MRRYYDNGGNHIVMYIGNLAKLKSLTEEDLSMLSDLFVPVGFFGYLIWLAFIAFNHGYELPAIVGMIPGLGIMLFGPHEARQRMKAKLAKREAKKKPEKYFCNVDLLNRERWDRMAINVALASTILVTFVSCGSLPLGIFSIFLCFLGWYRCSVLLMAFYVDSTKSHRSYNELMKEWKDFEDYLIKIKAEPLNPQRFAEHYFKYAETLDKPKEEPAKPATEVATVAKVVAPIAEDNGSKKIKHEWKEYCVKHPGRNYFIKIRKSKHLLSVTTDEVTVEWGFGQDKPIITLVKGKPDVEIKWLRPNYAAILIDGCECVAWQFR